MVALAMNLAIAGPAMTVAAQAVSDPALHYKTATPIKHVIVIFQENESFDHYFGTYPSAANPPGETPFIAAAGTPVACSMLRARLKSLTMSFTLKPASYFSVRT